jgi:ABC-2 type transport system permease protein
MGKYWRVLRLFWATAIAAELEYRLNFIIATLSSLGSLVGSLFSLFLFYRTGYQFAGWTWQEAMLVVGLFTFLQGISQTFLSPNLNRIVDQVQQGTLDYVLLKPINSQFWLSTRMVSPWGMPDLLIGLTILLYMGSQLSLPIQRYFFVLFPLACGVLILYSLWFMLGATSIWFVKIYNVTEVLRGFLDAGRYPIVAYPSVYRFFFTFIVPVTFLTTVPAEILLGRSPIGWVIGAACLGLTLLLLSNLLWRFALRFYTSASS